MIPLRIGTPEQFAQIRTFLRDNGYTESQICERTGFAALEQFLSADPDPAAPPPADSLDLLIRLFLRGSPVSSAIAAALPSAFREIGLVTEWAGTSVAASCALYPASTVWVASDRWSNPDRSPFEPPDDIVYPALTPNTRILLDMVADSPCDDFLELCSGTGAAALLGLQRGARRACAFDLVPRCSEYARFNAALNDLELEIGTGDLFAPAEGRKFDRIVANPPYMPTLEKAMVFADGGQFGEAILRRIVREVPSYLKPGGRLYCLMLGAELAANPVEQRVRQWLDSPGCDVALFVRQSFAPRDIAMQAAIRTAGGSGALAKWRASFEEEKVVAFLFCALVIQRPSPDRAGLTLRRTLGPAAGVKEMDWLLDWEGAGKSQVASLRPKLGASVQLTVSYEFTGEGPVPRAFQLTARHPWDTSIPIEGWISHLVGNCKGELTGRELFRWAVQAGLIQTTTKESEFFELLAGLLGAGILEIG